MGKTDFDARSVLRLKEEVRFRQVADEGVVVKQEAGEVVVVNEVGAAAIQLIDGQRDIDTIVSELQAQYQVEAEQLRTDIVDFLASLLETGIAEVA